jgi:hypothetical protein
MTRLTRFCSHAVQLNPIDYANIIWACSKLDVDVADTPIWERLCAEIRSGSLRAWRPKELSTIIFALGAMKRSPGCFALDAMLNRIGRKAVSVPLKHIICAVSGAACLNHMPSQQLLTFVEDQLVATLLVVSPQ